MIPDQNKAFNMSLDHFNVIADHFNVIRDHTENDISLFLIKHSFLT
jgi:hypothetical protein